MHLPRESVANGNNPLATSKCGCEKARLPAVKAERRARRAGAETAHPQGDRNPVSKGITIRLPFGDKRKIDRETFSAIKRAIPIYCDDAAVANYAAAPHEGVTLEIVAAIRKSMTRSGELPQAAFSRQRNAA